MYSSNEILSSYKEKSIASHGYPAMSFVVYVLRNKNRISVPCNDRKYLTPNSFEGWDVNTIYEIYW